MLIRPLAFLLLPTLAQAQLVVPDTDNDRLMLFDANDGSLLDDNFLDLSTGTPAAQTPVEVIEVGGEFLISDRFADTVLRYNPDGTFLGTITSGLDFPNGIEVVGNSLFVVNNGTANGGFGDVVLEYDLAGNLLNTIPTGDASDVLDLGTGLLVSNTADDDLLLFDYDGTSLGVFHNSDGVTGIDFPRQMSIKANGNILAVGQSSPMGIFEYDRATGAQVNVFDTGGIFMAGVQELGNGNLMFTTGSGVFVYDLATQVSTAVIEGVDARSITALNQGDFGTNYCISTANSAGGGAVISVSGSASVSSNNLFLRATPVPNQPGLFFYGPDQILAPFGDGFRCVGGMVGRLPVENGVNANLTHALDNTMPPNAAVAITSGTTWNFQAWFRDPAAGGANFNLSDAIEINFLP